MKSYSFRLAGEDFQKFESIKRDHPEMSVAELIHYMMNKEASAPSMDFEIVNVYKYPSPVPDTSFSIHIRFLDFPLELKNILTYWSKTEDRLKIKIPNFKAINDNGEVVDVPVLTFSTKEQHVAFIKQILKKLQGFLNDRPNDIKTGKPIQRGSFNRKGVRENKPFSGKPSGGFKSKFKPRSESFHKRSPDAPIRSQTTASSNDGSRVLRAIKPYTPRIMKPGE